MNIAVEIPKIAFLFLVFSIISGCYVQTVLSCEMQKILIKSVWAKHMIGFILIFMFIMMDGSWSNDPAHNDFDNNWTSGNVIDSLQYALIIYIIFILSGKSRLIPNLIFFCFLFTLYLVNTQRQYWLVREKLTPQQNKKILAIEYILLVFVICSFIYSFYDYVRYKKIDYKKNFSWYKFLVGTAKCRFHTPLNK